jgi:small subunit ribosomal protein S2
MPVLALCDTNNQANNIDFVIPCNNKGKKSLGLIFYILAKEYMKRRGLIKSDKEFKEKQAKKKKSYNAAKNAVKI